MQVMDPDILEVSVMVVDTVGAAVSDEDSVQALAGVVDTDGASGGEAFTRHGVPAMVRRSDHCMAIPMG